MSVSPCGEQGKSPMIVFPRGARVGWRVRRGVLLQECGLLPGGAGVVRVGGRERRDACGTCRRQGRRDPRQECARASTRRRTRTLGMAKTRPVDEGKDIEVVEQHDDQDKGKLFFAARPRPEQPAVPVLVCKHRPHSASLVNRGRAAGRRERGSACVLATSRRSSLVRYSFVAGAKVRVRRGRQNSKCHSRPLPTTLTGHQAMSELPICSSCTT